MSAFFNAVLFGICCVLFIAACADLSAPTSAETSPPAQQSSALVREDEITDQDRDHHVAEVDCNDHAPAIHPGALETCDLVDNNCNGITDEPWSIGDPYATFYRKPCIAMSAQGDGSSCAAAGIWLCDASGLRLICSAEPRLPQPERCNDTDDDCDGIVDNRVDWPQIDAPCSITVTEYCMLNGLWTCDAYTQEPHCSAEDEPHPQELCASVRAAFP